MSALRRIKKVEGGYEVTVKCTNKPMEERVYRTYAQCEKFADDYFFDYLGVQLKSVHHPEGDGVEPDGVNPESLETVEIEIPTSERNLELAAQAGLQQRINDPNEIWGYRADLEFFADLVRQDEREACAKLCEDLQLTDLAIRDWSDGTYDCAKAIRARGEK